MPETEQTSLLTEAELELRERLTQLAKGYFLEQGYTSSTMEQVSKTAKVSKKTVYRLFGTKAAVLHSVVHSIMHEIEGITSPLFEGTIEPFETRFKNLVLRISPQYAQLRSPASIKELRIVAPDTYEEFDTWRRTRFAQFVAMMAQPRASGLMSSEIDFDESIAIYAALHNSCMDYSILKESDIPPEQVYLAFVDIFLNGILSRGGQHT